MDWDPKSSKQWICKEWVGKLGSNESNKHKSRFRWQEDVNGQVYNEENHHRQSLRRSILIFLSDLITKSILDSTVIFSLFLPLLPMEDFLHYIVPFERSWSYTYWSFEPLFECLSHQTSSLAFLWVVIAKVALLRGLLHINTARELAAGHSMRW